MKPNIQEEGKPKIKGNYKLKQDTHKQRTCLDSLIHPSMNDDVLRCFPQVTKPTLTTRRRQ